MAQNQPSNPADRIAPNSTEAEDAVLGSILINPELVPIISSVLSTEDFFLVKNGIIWDAVLAVAQRGDAVDNLTVVDELQISGKLDLIGGSSAITRLTNNTPTYIHAETYARLVQRTSIRRKLLTAAGEIATLALQENMALPELLAKAHLLLTEASTIKQNAEFRFFSEIASENFDKVEAQYNGEGEPLGIPTGLTDLDEKLAGHGFQDGNLYIVAARPGMGKTSAIMGFATHATRHGKRAAVISKETTANDLHFRVMAAETGINTNKLKAADLDEGEWGRFTEATARTSQMELAIDDDGIADIDQLCGKIIRLYREWGVDIVFVDYLQLLYTDDGDSNRNNEVARISRKLKQLAMSLKIPIVALSQLNRNLEARKDKRPTMPDLRDSGALEQDADGIVFIYRDDYYDENSERPGQADFIIAKQRDGESNVTVPVRWIGNVTKFTDLVVQSISLEGF